MKGVGSPVSPIASSLPIPLDRDPTSIKIVQP